MLKRDGAGADRAAGRAGGETVFRNKIMTWIAVAVAAVLVLIATGLTAAAKRDFHLSFFVVVPLVGWANVTLIWMMGLSGIRVRADGLVVDSFLLRTVIPWEQYRGLVINPAVGLMVRVADRGAVACMSYGRSLAGGMSGYSLMAATQQRIEAACRQAIAQHAPVSPATRSRRLPHFPAGVAAALLAYFEAVSWLSYFLHRL